MSDYIDILNLYTECSSGGLGSNNCGQDICQNLLGWMIWQTHKTTCA